MHARRWFVRRSSFNAWLRCNGLSVKAEDCANQQRAWRVLVFGSGNADGLPVTRGGFCLKFFVDYFNVSDRPECFSSLRLWNYRNRSSVWRSSGDIRVFLRRRFPYSVWLKSGSDWFCIVLVIVAIRSTNLGFGLCLNCSCLETTSRVRFSL